MKTVVNFEFLDPDEDGLPDEGARCLIITEEGVLEIAYYEDRKWYLEDSSMIYLGNKKIRGYSIIKPIERYETHLFDT